MAVRDFMVAATCETAYLCHHTSRAIKNRRNDLSDGQAITPKAYLSKIYF